MRWRKGSDDNALGGNSYFQNTATYTNVSQANVTFEFWGNSIRIFGGRNRNHGNFKVQIDDQVFDSLGDHSKAPNSFQQPLFEQSGLLSGKHAVVVTNMQEGMVVDIDFVCVYRFFLMESFASFVAFVLIFLE
jgi:hypothetical protein